MDSGTIFSISICVAAAIAVALLIARWRETGRPIKHEPARVVAKRFQTQTNGYPAGIGRQVSTHYFATFELKSGRRMEFAVQAGEFGLMAEGDKGTLSRRGRRYLGFGRDQG